MTINIPFLERFTDNSCFVLLFCTTIYYWSKMLFSRETSYNSIGLIGFGSTVIFLTIHLLIRWFDSGHFPLSNLYESLLFLTWCILILHIYIETTTKTLFLGVLTAPALLCLVAFTDFSLPSDLQKSSPLVPALQSNWLIMHVTVMIASYAALLLGCLISIAYLIFFKFFNSSTPQVSKTVTDPFFEQQLKTKSQSIYALENQLELNQSNFSRNLFSNSSLSSTSETTLEKSAQNTILPQTSLDSKNLGTTDFLLFLDNLSYRTIGLGFCFLTLGILSGAVWANETWGSYWSWDPKETWAFLTWLTFACYLHSRLIGGWTGLKAAWIATFGFLIVWMCYLGVNLLGQGLHSYGFLNL